MSEGLEILITIVTSGGLASLVTLSATRRKASANADASVLKNADYLIDEWMLLAKNFKSELEETQNKLSKLTTRYDELSNEYHKLKCGK